MRVRNVRAKFENIQLYGNFKPAATPEHCLSVAIIIRAIMDAIGKESIYSIPKGDRESALGFIFGTGKYKSIPDGLTFYSRCEQVGINPLAVREKITQAIKSDSKKQLAQQLKVLSISHRVKGEKKKENG